MPPQSYLFIDMKIAFLNRFTDATYSTAAILHEMHRYRVLVRILCILIHGYFR